MHRNKSGAAPRAAPLSAGKVVYLLVGSICAAMLGGCAEVSKDGPEIATKTYSGEPFPVRPVNRSKFDASFTPISVSAPQASQPGTIVVDTKSKFLYLIETQQTARRYRIAVGAAGHAWRGEATIGRKSKWPAWYPTDDMHAQAPGLPRRIEPGPANPLGARALYLYANSVDTLYRIHGTSEPWTIGTEASSGCIRMFNEDAIDLFDRVRVGAKVVVRG